MTALAPSVIAETSRLRLRQWRPGDAPQLHRVVLGDPAVMVFSLGVLSLEETRSWIERKTAAEAESGFTHWAMEERSTGELIGICGLAVQPLQEGPFLEVGYRLARARWGNGLATEAVRATLDWAWEHTGFDRITAIIHPENQRSARVAQKAGMTIAWESNWYGMLHNIHVIDRPAGGRQ